jgi:hypothetical protein
MDRIPNHGSDIGGHIVFLVVGERMKNAMQQYR